MTFDDWRALSPANAAQTVLRRIRERLSPAQQRAVFRFVPTATALTHAFASADRSLPLGGVPFAIKDLFDLAGVPTFAGSTFLPDVRPTPPADGAFVTALRQAGAVPAGKTQMHEFAYGITGENAHFGDCERPGFPGRVSGGSSSGSAAAVAAGIVPLALASDTGGSVRLPAAFCGLWGIRCAPREPWIADAVPLSPTFDAAGWFTATAADMRTSLRALIGLASPQREPRGCFVVPAGLDPDVAAACLAAAERLATPADADTASAAFAAFAPTAQAYGVITGTDAWRYHSVWADRYRERYDPSVWHRLTFARRLTADQQRQAADILGRTRAFWSGFFAAWDFLVLPASPCAALLKSDCTQANRERILALTAPASLAGLPVLTVPVQLPSGLSTGLQIIVPAINSPSIAWILPD
ncbi:amidase [Horticoccus luteus]|uniref:Amidase n=1 Tax=Horticoccus luteus TaxID=2862869 RepID=A0A8F9TYH7_9BACT|nr:amidase [Horticoccus luteus]QYM80194.1 amidase [Horticoccus luteus]